MDKRPDSIHPNDDQAALFFQKLAFLQYCQVYGIYDESHEQSAGVIERDWWEDICQTFGITDEDMFSALKSHAKQDPVSPDFFDRAKRYEDITDELSAEYYEYYFDVSVSDRLKILADQETVPSPLEIPADWLADVDEAFSYAFDYAPFSAQNYRMNDDLGYLGPLIPEDWVTHFDHLFKQSRVWMNGLQRKVSDLGYIAKGGFHPDEWAMVSVDFSKAADVDIKDVLHELSIAAKESGLEAICGKELTAQWLRSCLNGSGETLPPIPVPEFDPPKGPLDVDVLRRAGL